MLTVLVAQQSILSCLYFACGGERLSSIWENIWIMSQARPQGVLLLGGLFSDRLVNAPLFTRSFVGLSKRNEMSGIVFSFKFFLSSFNTLFVKMFLQEETKGEKQRFILVHAINIINPVLTPRRTAMCRRTTIYVPSSDTY